MIEFAPLATGKLPLTSEVEVVLPLPLPAAQVQTAGLAAVQERKVLPAVGCAPGRLMA